MSDNTTPIDPAIITTKCAKGTPPPSLSMED